MLRKKMDKNEDGFTLLETLLVLFIIGSTFLIPVMAIDKMIDQTTVDLFLRELTANMTAAHNHAVLFGEQTIIEFYSSTEEEFIAYSVQQQPNHPLRKKQVLNTDYYYFRNKEPKKIYFKSYSGHISESGNIRFRTVQGDYRLRYWLGSGRFEITRVSLP